MAIRLVVGLGNPDPEHERTRHNIGFMVLDEFEGDPGWEGWKDWRGGLGRVGRLSAAGAAFHCVEPLTYMNESGRMVGSFCRFQKIAPAETLVVFDDFALPLGRLRLRGGGSAGGHNGMQSVIDHLGTHDVPRLRVGIGPLPSGTSDPVKFVLTRFKAGEHPLVDEAVGRAARAVLTAVADGFEAAMNRFNAHEPETT